MNPEVSGDDPRIPSRPLWAFAILSMPIIGIFLTILAYAAMWAIGLSGRAASGAPIRLSFDGCAEARPLMAGRLDDMGLEATWDNGDSLSVTVVSTGDPEVDATLAQTLATPAALEVKGEGEVLATNADLVDASVRMDLFMVPFVLLKLRAEAAERVKVHVREYPGSKLQFAVDGQTIGWQSNLNPVAVGDLEINLDEDQDLSRLRAVAAFAVMLDHGPLPCAVRPQ